jgi:hypothetical protein
MGEDRVGKWQKKKPEYRKQAVERMGETKNLGLLAIELGVSVRTLYRWRDRQLGREKKAREPELREKKLEGEIQQLKLSLAKRTLEVDFFKGALQKVAARRQGGDNSGEKASTTRSGK